VIGFAFFSGHTDKSVRCQLYPRKRTNAATVRMSTLCQKRTSARSHFLILERKKKDRLLRDAGVEERPGRFCKAAALAE
jgi:hypothetical protein